MTQQKNEMTINQKLNKILEHIVENPEKINLNQNFIQQILFKGSITLTEATQLHRKITNSGIVRLIGGKYPAYSMDTELFLNSGGFGGGYENNFKKTSNKDEEQIIEKEPNGEVFISYSWDTLEHQAKVLSFTNHLRKKGFHAQLDKMLSQNDAAINFIKMMHKAMLEHPKVIVVLSAGYKQKAETFTGGVGEEYELLLNDIKKNPKKYILVSFEGRSDDIIPYGLQGREIIDLSNPNGEEILFRKLMDQNTFLFSPVASQKPQLPLIQIDEFEKTKFPINIEPPSLIKAGSASQGGLYHYVDFKLILNFKNLASTSIEGFAYELKIMKQLTPKIYAETISEGHFILSETISQKIFPNQTIKSKAYDIKISSNEVRKIIGSIITITVYSDHGEISKNFNTEELFKIPPPNEPKKTMPLSTEIFH